MLITSCARRSMAARKIPCPIVFALGATAPGLVTEEEVDESGGATRLGKVAAGAISRRRPAAGEARTRNDAAPAKAVGFGSDDRPRARADACDRGSAARARRAAEHCRRGPDIEVSSTVRVRTGLWRPRCRWRRRAPAADRVAISPAARLRDRAVRVRIPQDAPGGTLVGLGPPMTASLTCPTSSGATRACTRPRQGTERQPSDDMFGLLDRLLFWLDRAAAWRGWRRPVSRCIRLTGVPDCGGRIRCIVRADAPGGTGHEPGAARRARGYGSGPGGRSSAGYGWPRLSRSLPW